MTIYTLIKFDPITKQLNGIDNKGNFNGCQFYKTKKEADAKAKEFDAAEIWHWEVDDQASIEEIYQVIETSFPANWEKAKK